MKYILSSINRINLSNMQKYIFIKPGLFVLILSFLITNTYAQTGLNFQGVARSSNNVILASQDITIKLSILKNSATGTAEYTEIRKVTTNAQGLFTAVIGDTGAISTLGNFTTINWKLSPKFLKIEMDPAAGNNFMTMGTTQFQYVAYAQFAKSVDAENIVGILPVSKGGTGLSSIAELKSALALDKINNTADADKPISTKTQTALDLIAVTATDTTRFLKRINSKADTADVNLINTTLGTKLNAADTIKFTKQTYSDSSLLTKLKISDTSAMLSSRIKSDTLNLSNRINLKANTIDVNLITTTLGTKLNAADTIKYTKQAYSDSSLLTKLKISDTSAMLSSRIKRDTLNLSNRINSKANTTDLSLGLELKESISNKSTATDLGGTSPSDVLFPTQKAVKEYIAANNAGGGVDDGDITNIKLADGAVTYAKFQSIPTNTILGNTSSSTTSVQAIATTGSDNVVLSTSPTITSPILITPNIGVATATSINDVIINGFNFKSDLPSLTITGTTTLQGDNTGDNATNTKYEGLLTYGAVDLITDQAIDGKKTFLNNIIMANLLGAGSITPTTINFANGSKIGDIQNINEDNPDADGSIDLYAPDGAKWVQMNYGNANYIWIDSTNAFIDIGEKRWRFKKDGSTLMPGNLVIGHRLTDTAKISSPANLNIQLAADGNENFLWNWKFNKDGTTELPFSLAMKSDIMIGKGYLDYPGESFFDTARILSPTNIQIGIGSYTGPVMDSFKWKFNKDGTTELPGALNFTDNHAINFTSTGTSTPTTNASITSEGPIFKIQTREVTETEYDADLNYGIELNYADRNKIELSDYMYFLNHDDDDNNDNYWSAASFNYDNFNFIINNNLIQYKWQFKDDGSTELPGDLIIPTTGTLKLGNTIFPNVSGNPDDVLTMNGFGNAVWQAPVSSSDHPILINAGDANFGLTINSESSNSWGSGIEFKSSVDYDTPYKGLFQLDGEGSMVFRTLQNGMYFDNFGNGNINFRVGTEGGNISGMILDNLGKLAVHGTVSSAGTNLTSDIRLKKNITPIQNSLSIIQKLNPVSYDKKMNLASLDYSIKENGFIAQELQKILPNLVHESSDKDKLLSVNYTAIIPILTKGIQEQQVIIEDQKKRLEALEKLVSDLINKK